MNLAKNHIEKIKTLCKKHHVDELYAFGSALTEQFSSKSDIDFLVKFSGVDLREYFDNYMDLKESLEDLLSRHVDLVEIQTINNPILKKSINRNKQLLYGRKDSKIPV